jgi:hypothetical protein
MGEYVSESKPKLDAILRVSKRGKGLYLYLPDDVVAYLGVSVGWKLRVEIQEVLRPKTFKEIQGGES